MHRGNEPDRAEVGTDGCAFSILVLCGADASRCVGMAHTGTNVGRPDAGCRGELGSSDVCETNTGEAGGSGVRGVTDFVASGEGALDTGDVVGSRAGIVGEFGVGGVANGLNRCVSVRPRRLAKRTSARTGVSGFHHA
jgi:hypothetical protein